MGTNSDLKNVKRSSEITLSERKNVGGGGRGWRGKRRKVGKVDHRRSFLGQKLSHKSNIKIFSYYLITQIFGFPRLLKLKFCPACFCSKITFREIT
jgi:hypothetical protein